MKENLQKLKVPQQKKPKKNKTFWMSSMKIRLNYFSKDSTWKLEWPMVEWTKMMVITSKMAKKFSMNLKLKMKK